jgi:Domain of unknown function (DUF1508)
MTYYYLKDHKGEWRWHLKATDGRFIAGLGEGYESGRNASMISRGPKTQPMSQLRSSNNPY